MNGKLIKAKPVELLLLAAVAASVSLISISDSIVSTLLSYLFIVIFGRLYK